MRFRAAAQRREIDQARSLERERLARELHDTVAHHVSAIAIQAQAGRAVASKRPEAAVDALAITEEAASRTLTELRGMVGTLRGAEAGELAPQQGLTELSALTSAPGDPRVVDVRLEGDLDDLRPAVQAALYRLAQEAVTNALRHARGATRVEVVVHGVADEVHLTVVDDGELPSGSGRSPGFGLVGMAERAALLGGTFEAGPQARRGWSVQATLPKHVDRGESAP